MCSMGGRGWIPISNMTDESGLTDESWLASDSIAFLPAYFVLKYLSTHTGGFPVEGDCYK